MGVLKLPDVNFGTTGSWLCSPVAIVGPDTVIGGVTPSSSLYNLVNGIMSTVAREGMFIYRGTPPMQTELDSFEASTSQVLLSAPTSNMLRSADLLSVLRPKSAVFSKNSAVISFPPTPALLTGTASWFLLGLTWYSADYPSVYIAGTIGSIGSGADLEVYTQSLVAGSYYKLPIFTVNFNNSMSF